MSPKNLSAFIGTGFYAKSITFSILSILAAAANYALYPIIARILSIDLFGEFSVLLAIVTQIGGILLAFNVISIFLVAKYGEEKSKHYLSSIQKILVSIFIVLSLLSFLFSPLIISVLHITHLYEMVIITGILIIAIPSALWSGYFQGNGELIRVGLLSLSSSIAKLALATVGALFYGVSGALLGVLVGSFIGLIVCWFIPGLKPPLLGSILIRSFDIESIKKLKSIIIRAIVAVAIISVYQTLDLLIVKILYSPADAGTYAGVSALARIIYYVGFIAVWILLPEIAKAELKHKKNLIKKSCLVYGAITILAVLITAFIGKNIITILLGAQYSLSTPLILCALLFQSMILFMTFQIFTLLVLDRKYIIYPILSGLVLCIVFSFLKTASSSMVNSVAAFVIITAIVSLALSFIIYKTIYYEPAKID